MRLTRSQVGMVVAVAMLGAGVAPAAAQTVVYPSQGQSPQQESMDKGQCNQWAVQQTGIDPTSPTFAAQAGPPPAAPQPGSGAMRGAFRGAALGAAGGAIGGDAGKGAAIGAGVGGLFGAMRTREEYASQQQAYGQQQQQAQAMNAQRLDTYNRAVNACLAGRGYTVR